MAALTAVEELRRRRLGLDLLMTIAAARATVLGGPESWDAVPKSTYIWHGQNALC
jgi:hypothetical protein